MNICQGSSTPHPAASRCTRLMRSSAPQVGAGTMNPATFLHVLGPEPWNVCYPEPSVRPDDSRYGDNPNRVQRHTQFQVILKPDRGNSQELYLGSLEALGIDTCAHDVRFVEDNWESPALGAWGLGWEVWLDGMEVTQFTYFQQCGASLFLLLSSNQSKSSIILLCSRYCVLKVLLCAGPPNCSSVVRRYS